MATSRKVREAQAKKIAARRWRRERQWDAWESQPVGSDESLNDPASWPEGEDWRKVEFAVIVEPIPDPAYEALPEEWKQRLDPVYRQPVDDFAPHLDLLNAAVAEFPQVPRLWNLLYIAYTHAGRDADAECVLWETLERHPDYFFARINQATLLISEGRHDEVEAALGGDLDLQRLVGGRKQVHYTEVRCYFLMMLEYHLARKALLDAASTLDILEGMNPDDPHVQNAGGRMKLALLEHIAENPGFLDTLPRPRARKWR
jgi:hypothetical protein